jgi:ribonuclease HII
MLTPTRTVIRREAGLYALERALQRRGFRYVAGADEAGRGACAGPLVAAAAILPEGRRGEVDGLADSKLLTPAARERVYADVVVRALAYSVVIVPPAEVDTRGLHVCNLSAMRRALASLTTGPEYVLTDGFPVDGLGVPGLAVWKGDRVAACVAAASVLAKVTRDRLMVELDGRYPDYGFAEHKGYVTDEHSAALSRHGPCIEHRFSYVNVAAVSGRGNRPPRARRPRAVIVPPSLSSSPSASSSSAWSSGLSVASSAGLSVASSSALSSRSEEALTLWSVAEGTVGVASGEQPQPPTPVGEDGAMEGDTR